jgi:glycerol-3-phosphate acyltransferase PlsY
MLEVITLGSVLAAYLIGAVPFGLLIARAYGISDLRCHGSGNIGATNVWRVVGKAAAVWVFILDIGKGALVVALARMIHQTVLPSELFVVLCGLAAVIGHLAPVYLSFRGGKGVNTSAGVMVTLLPVEVAICIVVFLMVLIVSRFVSLGSIVATLSLALIVGVERFVLNVPIDDVYLFVTGFFALIVVYTHRQNILRILNGTENRFSFSSGGTKGEDHA